MQANGPNVVLVALIHIFMGHTHTVMTVLGEGVRLDIKYNIGADCRAFS